MRKATVIVAILAVFCFSAARAAEEVDAKVLCGLTMPGCCELTCLSLELGCNCCTSSADEIVIDLLDASGAVIATATVPGPWCTPCCGHACATAALSEPVTASRVKWIKLTKPGADDLYFNWLELDGLCGSGCCGKWCELFDCCVPIWMGDGDCMVDVIVLN